MLYLLVCIFMFLNVYPFAGACNVHVCIHLYVFVTSVCVCLCISIHALRYAVFLWHWVGMFKFLAFRILIEII